MTTRIARDVIGTIMGEAVSGSRTERLADMLGIASTIANRAALTGVSPADIVAAPGQYSAYGKALPPGVEAYRSLAEQAWGQIQTTGPTTPATYYATPAAASNLPSDLAPAGTTAGHHFFTDPAARAIGTAQGYVRPDPQAAATLAAPQPVDYSAPGILGLPPTDLTALSTRTPRPTPTTISAMPFMAPAGVPAPAPVSTISAAAPARTVGLGMMALTPEMAQPATIAAPGLNFPHANQTGISPGLAASLTGLSAEFGQPLGVISGYRSPDHNRAVGGAKQSLHMQGKAADIDMTGWSSDQRQAAVRELTQRGIGGFITYSNPNEQNMLHVDMRQRSLEPTTGEVSPHFMYDRTAGLMSKAPGWFQEAAAYGGLVTPPAAPTPTARPDLAAINADLAAAPIGPVTSAPLGMAAFAPTNPSVAPGPMASAPVASMMTGGISPAAPMGSRVTGLGSVAPMGDRVAPMSAPSPERMAAFAPMSLSVSSPVTPAAGYSLAQDPGTLTAFGGIPSPARPDNRPAPTGTGLPGPLGVPSALTSPVTVSSIPAMPVSMPATLAAPPLTATPRPSLLAPPMSPLAVPLLAKPAPAMRVASQPATARPSVPSVSPMATAGDVYFGRADSGYASDGSKVSRNALGGVSITNRFGVTSTTNAAGQSLADWSGTAPAIGSPSSVKSSTTIGAPSKMGSKLGMAAGGLFGAAAAGAPGAIAAGYLGGRLGPTAATPGRPASGFMGSPMVGGIVGGVAGGLMGGPLGLGLGAWAGSKIASGVGFGPGAFLGAFPSAPAAPANPGNGGWNSGLLGSLSPGERSAVTSSPGLY